MPTRKTSIAALLRTMPLAGLLASPVVLAQPLDLGLAEGSAAGGERIVKGAPYCAEAVHETVQWLADPAGGAPNRIARQQTSRLCRDGEGRTRQEVDHAGRKRIYLRDPVTGQGWMLDPVQKTAVPNGGRLRELRLASGPDGVLGEAEASVWREYSERIREWAREAAERVRAGSGTPARPPMPPLPPVPPGVLPPGAGPAMAPVIISRGDGGTVHMAGADGAELTVLRLAADTAAGGPPRVEALPLGLGLAASRIAPRGPGATTPLPAREIEGLRVSGERTSWQIEAGRVGNERPIQIVREVWTSPELMLTVQSRDFDPRVGEVNYRLRSVQRGEPDPTLFRVPADYRQRGRVEQGREERRDERRDERR